MYDDVSLLIDGAWGPGKGNQTMPILNPATSAEIGKLACAEESDLERAAEAAARAFRTWSKTSAFERYKLMRKAAELLRQRVDGIARRRHHASANHIESANRNPPIPSITSHATCTTLTGGRSRSGTVSNPTISVPVWSAAFASPAALFSSTAARASASSEAWRTMRNVVPMRGCANSTIARVCCAPT